MPAPALACPGRPGLQEGLGRVQRQSKPREPEGAGAVVDPGSSWRLRRSSSGKPCGRSSRAPSPRALALWAVISDLGAQGRILGPAGVASGVHDLLFLAGPAGARKLFIDQTVRAPCVNGTPRASRADIPAPPLAPPPRAPQPAPPPAGTAPPPSSLYGQGSPAVRQRRPRPSPCVTEHLRGGSVRPGSPSD